MKNDILNSSQTHSEAIKDHENKLSFKIASAPMGIGEISLQPPRFKWVNEGICNILDYTEKELLAMNPFDLIVEENKLLLQERMRKILSREKVLQSVEYKIKTKNGRILWVNLNVNLLHKNDEVIVA